MSKIFSYKLGGNRGETFTVQISPDQLIVRTQKLSDGSRKAVPELPAFDYRRLNDVPQSGVAVLQFDGSEAHAQREAARTTYRSLDYVAFAGRAVQHPVTLEPLIYTENLFLRFRPSVKVRQQLRLIQRSMLSVKRELKFAEGAYLLAAQHGIGTDIFELSLQLLENDIVELCHPELLWLRNTKAVHPKQWHLATTNAYGPTLSAHAHVAAAHALSTGRGTTIAVIDDGVEVSHAEFSAFGKCVHPYDFATRVADAKPKKAGHAHGTNCAGVACAAGVEASGVAPDALLMPLVIPEFIGSAAEAEALTWAADHGADVISCSWGPKDGLYTRPNDPLHTTRHPLPDMTRLAMDYAATRGRQGKGCVITWAAGNGNESVDLDGYASYEKVMAIGACNERGERSIYSDFGKALSCCFPSGDYQQTGKPPLLTNGLYVADRAGFAGISAGAYTDGFTGTSAACPGVAGVAALILSVAPHLTAAQVRSCIETTCTKIDETKVAYDLQGHSLQLGYGRVHAFDAVTKALSLNKPQGLRITRLLVAPAKGTKEAVEIKNLGSVQVRTRILGKCANRTEWVEIDIPPGQTKTYNLATLKLPNSKGQAVFQHADGTQICRAVWRKSDLDGAGWIAIP